MAADVELAEWQGRARMAEARLVARGPGALSEVDVEALRHCPDPPGIAGLPRRRPPVVFDADGRPGINHGMKSAGFPLSGDIEEGEPDTTRRARLAAITAGYDQRVAEAREARRAAAMPGHLAAGIQRRDDALDRVDTHADPEWKDAAKAAIRLLAETLPELTGDDLWRLVPKPAEPRASGPIFRWAAGQGLIAATDRFVPTTQATSHASPSRVWKSLTYRGD